MRPGQVYSAERPTSDWQCNLSASDTDCTVRSSGEISGHATERLGDAMAPLAVLGPRNDSRPLAVVRDLLGSHPLQGGPGDQQSLLPGFGEADGDLGVVAGAARVHDHADTPGGMAHVASHR